MSAEKACSRCHEVKPLEDFPATAAHGTGGSRGAACASEQPCAPVARPTPPAPTSR